MKSNNKDKTKFHDTSIGRHGTPDVRFDFVFDKIGYQMDVYSDGEPAVTICRDFGGSHKIPVLQMDLIKQLMKAVDRFREKH